MATHALLTSRLQNLKYYAMTEIVTESELNWNVSGKQIDHFVKNSDSIIPVSRKIANTTSDRYKWSHGLSLAESQTMTLESSLELFPPKCELILFHNLSILYKMRLHCTTADSLAKQIKILFANYGFSNAARLH